MYIVQENFMVIVLLSKTSKIRFWVNDFQLKNPIQLSGVISL